MIGGEEGSVFGKKEKKKGEGLLQSDLKRSYGILPCTLNYVSNFCFQL